MSHYPNPAAAIADLKSRGYVQDYCLTKDGQRHDCQLNGLSAAHFQVAEVYRFDGNEDPDEGEEVYALTCDQGGRGVLINHVSSDCSASKLIRKLKFM